MQFVVDIPDAVAARLGVTSAAAREALLVDAYRTGHLTAAELQELLSLPTGDAVDAVLKAHGVPLEYTEADLAREGALMARLWPRPVATRQP